jgi:hypothetical protein
MRCAMERNKLDHILVILTLTLAVSSCALMIQRSIFRRLAPAQQPRSHSHYSGSRHHAASRHILGHTCTCKAPEGCCNDGGPSTPTLSRACGLRRTGAVRGSSDLHAAGHAQPPQYVLSEQALRSHPASTENSGHTAKKSSEGAGIVAWLVTHSCRPQAPRLAAA